MLPLMLHRTWCENIHFSQNELTRFEIKDKNEVLSQYLHLQMDWRVRSFRVFGVLYLYKVRLCLCV